MIDGLHCPKFLLLFQTGNVSYALSLSQELLHYGNSFHLTLSVGPLYAVACTDMPYNV